MQTSDLSAPAISLKKYFIVYALAYLASIVVILLLQLVDIDVKAASFSEALVAITTTLQYFIKDQQRKPTRSEKWRLIWGSMLTGFAVSLVCVTAALLFPGTGLFQELAEIFSKLPPSWWLVIVLVVALIDLLTHWGLYSLLGRMLTHHLEDDAPDASPER